MKKTRTLNNIQLLMIGTSKEKAKDLLNKDFNGLVWFTNNLETAAHYYEGSMVQITVTLESKKEMMYVGSYDELNKEYGRDREYTFGIWDAEYPKGVTWYSFGKNYLKSHLSRIIEITPDMSKYGK